MEFNVNNIAIAGAGTMGSGIAQVCLMAGFPTVLYDISESSIEKARQSITASIEKLIQKSKISEQTGREALDKLQITTDIKQLQADLIIEAVIENLDVKHEFFRTVAGFNKPNTILASNTSSIPITRIAAKIPNPERVVGVHFFNPAPVMKLVEIISGAQTDVRVAQFCKQLFEGMGKTCVMAADAPGFIVNRVARHFYVEALKILEEGVADFNTIDDLAENAGFKMGPFKLMDLIGVDTNLSVTTSMYQLFNQDGKFRPSRIQQQKVEAGLLGKKTGKGFYTYEEH